MNLKPVRIEVEKLELRDGDYLAIIIPEYVDIPSVESLSKSIKDGFPELAGRIIICWGDLKMKVIKNIREDV